MCRVKPEDVKLINYSETPKARKISQPEPKDRVIKFFNFNEPLLSLIAQVATVHIVVHLVPGV